ncbi:MAG TPA: glycosyltransferase family 4 protein [Ginsengibacter sp.]|nr:glycosyltransferase family 4 protein [Ginsengibacter sp.]
MRILIPVLGFGQSGGSRVLSKFADELIRLGHCVDFLSPDTSKIPYFPTSASILWVDKKGNLISYRNFGTRKATALSNQKRLLKAFRKLDAKSYDIIIANQSLTTIPVKISGLAPKTLYYVQAYEPDYYHLIPTIKNKILEILSICSYKMNFFTVVNAEIYLKFKKLRASRVLYPGIDFNIFYPIKKEIKKEKEIIIGTIGRIEPQKGTRYVLEAFNKLRKTHKNIKLYVAFGNQEDFEGLEDVYCFQPHGDMALADFYRKLDYYFCAGFVQIGAFHYPVVEAMSCGISLITTQYFPTSDNNSWIVSPKNAEDIVKKFELAHNNSELREKKIGQALNDVQQFDWKILGEKLNAYLKELMDTHNIL